MKDKRERMEAVQAQLGIIPIHTLLLEGSDVFFVQQNRCDFGSNILTPK